MTQTGNRLFLGVDPGISGALVIVDSRGTCRDYLLMPSMKVGSKNRVNPAPIAAWLANWPVLDHAFIENVHSMPKDGATKAFSFGHSAGAVHGVVAGMGIPLTFISPRSWKNHHGLLGTEKDAARSRAVQLFPDVRELDKKAKGQALADALLIALYGSHKFFSTSDHVAA
jgi:crossover junction endodeoxyribonuclease RuvC